jgi:hypothetical protein
MVQGAADGVNGAAVHRSNALNELGGDAWLYFTRSLWTTTYPS